MLNDILYDNYMYDVTNEFNFTNNNLRILINSKIYFYQYC